MSYHLQGRSPRGVGGGQVPIVVTKAKYILPPKRSPRRSGKVKSSSGSSKLPSIAILGQINSKLVTDGEAINGSTVNHNGVKHHGAKNGSGGSAAGIRSSSANDSYQSYPGSDSIFTRTKTTYKNNLNEEIHRIYIQEGLNHGLLNDPKNAKRAGYTETDGYSGSGKSDGTGQSNGKLIGKKGGKSGSKSNKKRRTGKQLQTFIMRRILLFTNIVSLLLGVIFLVLAGIIDPQPLHRIGTTGGQISLASIYVIFVSLIGLYGSRLKNYRLLFIYAYTLLTGLVLRSFCALLSVYVYHNARRLILSMLFAIIEVILIFIGLAVAIDLKEETRRKSMQVTTTNTFKV